MIIDFSLSMLDEQKIVNATRGALAFIDQMHPGDVLKVLVFSDRNREIILPQWNNNFTVAVTRESLKSEISRTQAEGGTALYDSCFRGWELVSEMQRQDQARLGAKRRNYGVVLMTVRKAMAGPDANWRLSHLDSACRTERIPLQLDLRDLINY